MSFSDKGSTASSSTSSTASSSSSSLSIPSSTAAPTTPAAAATPNPGWPTSTPGTFSFPVDATTPPSAPPATTSATTPASSSPSFGAAAAATPSTSSFGRSPFGAAASSTSGSTASFTFSSFGSTTAPKATMKPVPNAFGPATGASPFGGQPAATAATSGGSFGFGAATSSGFGQPVTTGGFGQPAAAPASGGGGLFGTAPVTRGFGQPEAGPISGGGGLFSTAPATRGFGQPAAAPTSGGGGLFGTANTGGFGQPATTAAASGFCFGAATSGGFGQPAATSSAPADTASFLSSPAGHFASFTPTPERANVARLFDRRDLYPDVILQYQGQDIYAHRAILALGSPKLQKMFDDHSSQPPMMQENKPVYLLDDDVKGLQFTDVSRIIKFCYTGSFDADLPLARLVQVALVAEEFKMAALSFMCQTLCIDKVTAESSLEPILEALESAHQNGLVKLKKGIMNYLKQACPSLGASVDDFMRLDKDLLAEFLLHVTSMPDPSTLFGGFDFGSAM